MKKLLLPVLTALLVAGSTVTTQAQTVCPASASNVVSVGTGTPSKTGFEITQNTTWTRNNIYLLNGAVYVNDGVTLTIEPGTIIKGDLTNQGALIIRQGGKINAAGTATQPIVFTSNQPAGQRNPGDWGGLIICGRAPVNLPGNPSVEGGVVANFGGTNSADNSGVLQYVRIEFGGIAFLPNNEINGLTLAGVGSGTTIDHVQVTASGDDSFEWFGGAVNAKYLISLGATDDDFDTDNGFSGRVQYGLAIRDPRRGDTATGGVSNGFESDNDANGSANLPQTSAVFTNMTVFLPTSPTPASPFNNADGALIRRNSAESIFNSVFAGRPYGLNLNSNSTNLTTANAASGALAFQNNVLAGYATPGRAGRVTTNSGTTAGFSINTFLASNNDTTRTVAQLGLNADNFAFEGNCSANKPCVPGLQLPAASLLNSGAAFTNTKLTGNGNGGPNSTFDVVTYRGAFGATNWAEGWANFNPQITCYNAPGQTLAAKPASDQLQQLTVSPNPTAGEAMLNFELKRSGTASVRVLDVTGRTVATVLSNGRLAAGTQQIALPATLKAGVYTAQVTTSETSQSVRFVVAN